LSGPKVEFNDWFPGAPVCTLAWETSPNNQIPICYHLRFVALVRKARTSSFHRWLAAGDPFSGSPRLLRSTHVNQQNGEARRQRLRRQPCGLTKPGVSPPPAACAADGDSTKSITGGKPPVFDQTFSKFAREPLIIRTFCPDNLILGWFSGIFALVLLSSFLPGRTVRRR